MKRIYLMRHARTVNNKLNIVQGYSNDSCLLEESKIATRKVANFLISNKIVFSNVYASNNVRASQTAMYVTNNKYSIIKLDDLREMNFGSDEGKNIHYNFNRLLDVQNGFAPLGGETNREAADRLYFCLIKLINLKENSQILCVSSCAIILNFLKFYDTSFYKRIYESGSFTNLTTLILDYEEGNFRVIDELIFD